MGTATMSLLASLIALTNAQLESMKQLQSQVQSSLPTTQLHNLPSLHQNLQSLPSLHPLPNFLSANQPSNEVEKEEKERVPCTCGVFLSGQFKKGSQQQPTGNAALIQEITEPLQCNGIGEKQCINRCLETMVRHLPNSGPMICGSIDRDCVKERAYLFIKNCNDVWINSNLSAGREYCCKDGFPYKCPSS